MVVRSSRSPPRALCCAALLASAGALGQQPAADTAGLAEITVTGSHIFGPAEESLLPIQILQREDILHSGVTTTEELIATVPANLLSSNDQLGVGNSVN